MRRAHPAVLAGMLALSPSAHAAPACATALGALEAVESGYTRPAGTPPYEISLREKLNAGQYGAYTWSKEPAVLPFDAFREIGALREACPEGRWPEITTPGGVAKALAEKGTLEPRAFCGADTWGGHTAAEQVQHLMKGATWLEPEERRAELARQELSAELGRHPGAVRLADARWLRLAAAELATFCAARPELHQEPAAAALAAAEAAVARAERRVAWVACSYEKDAVQPQIAAVDAAAKAGDVGALSGAIAALEAAMVPVQAACAASPDGLADLRYTLDAKHIALIMAQKPECQPAAVAMSQARRAIDAAPDKEAALAAVAALREAGEAASAACDGRPELKRWAEYVAAVAEENVNAR